eukprot:3826067-Karenia_brevis.AAC.1
MVEGVTRAKRLLSLAREIGFEEFSHVIKLGSDRSAAKSFKKVQEGGLGVSKVPGEENPADLMTKVLGYKDIKSRLEMMSMEMR